ncbi:MULTISPECIES: amidohydrolase family protein [Alteromonadaceae]|uniref:Amidohydrolase family protein n=1 Tax=Brumicola blandensis TaxID=3075611 RepID=A0AAW8R1S9_9ALTE|nr:MULTISPECIES: amidohydrolase family protein [unclassified Alteromonas]MDT0581113.1 amidohydrolase family protein [Alteromonas sp. W409]MDT0626731.1 amidohydrolase family protein [Alteromonas sp. W364]
MFKPNIKFGLALAVSAALLSACSSDHEEQKSTIVAGIDTNPFPSTYKVIDSAPFIITNVTILDGIGGKIEDGEILIQDGVIKEVGSSVSSVSDAIEIDGEGKWLTPGIIDNHSHLGVYPSPSTHSHSDGNEMTGPVTAEVWAEHSIWPQDPGFQRALAGGVTSLQILPGSANLFGGRSVTVKNVPNRTMQDMKFPGAPYGIKMACGENPKRVYGQKGGPMTRMANVAGYRSAWIDAQGYQKDWADYQADLDAGVSATPPKRDLNLETLAGVLNGEILVHMHCYRADEMTVMMDVMKEFDYKIGTFHHAVEAYKIGDKLAENGVCSAMWADWWGFKMEAYDGIKENVAMVHAAKACAIVHSDSDLGIQRLNQEAAKAWADGKRAGIDISQADAWTWLSANPAKSLGIFDKTGSLEEGKNADVVLWSTDPFSTYAQAEKVFIDGAMVYDRNKPESWPVSDFELGQVAEGDAK